MADAEVTVFIAFSKKFVGWAPAIPEYRLACLNNGLSAVLIRQHQQQTGFTPLLKISCHSMAGATGLEPATSGVTGRRSNQLSYAPIWGQQELETPSSIVKEAVRRLRVRLQVGGNDSNLKVINGP
jgi:hypothetical protein